MILRLRSTLHASPRCAQDERKDTRTTGGRGESSRAWSIVPENGAFKVFKKPAPSAPSAPVKAERGAVQLCEAVHFREILSAPLLHRFCTFCTFCPVFGSLGRVLAASRVWSITIRDNDEYAGVFGLSSTW